MPAVQPFYIKLNASARCNNKSPTAPGRPVAGHKRKSTPRAGFFTVLRLVWLFCAEANAKDIIGKLNAAINAVADPAMRLRLVRLGFEVLPRAQQTPEVLNTL
jgi:hypothetical protein